MTLPASGEISTAQVRAEIGGSGDIVIPSAEVRTLTGVASGPVVLPTDFYGKSGGGGSDQTPAAMNFADITGTSPAANADVAVSGINVPIVLRATVGSVSGLGVLPRIAVFVNGSQVTDTPMVNGNTIDATVVVTDNVHYVATTNGANKACAMTVINLTDGNASIKVFNVSVDP